VFKNSYRLLKNTLGTMLVAFVISGTAFISALPVNAANESNPNKIELTSSRGDRTGNRHSTYRKAKKILQRLDQAVTDKHFDNYKDALLELSSLQSKAKDDYRFVILEGYDNHPPTLAQIKSQYKRSLKIYSKKHLLPSQIQADYHRENFEGH
jgi:hypothetical protein